MNASPLATRPRPPGEQNVATPRALLDAIEARWGKLHLDLCAEAHNACAPAFLSPLTDSLRTPWEEIRGRAWCNPPFKDIAPWVRKAAATRLRPGSKIFVLVPASVGSNWFRDDVHGAARVLFLNGRCTFQGHTTKYPKDLLLAVYGELPSLEIWTWGTARKPRGDRELPWYSSSTEAVSLATRRKHSYQDDLLSAEEPTSR